MARAEVLHWDSSDYLSDWKTRRLDLRVTGAYRLLLDHMWTGSDEQCVFPLDYAALAGIWNVCPEEALEILDVIQTPGMPLLRVVKRHKKPTLYSTRLAKQANRARVASERQAEKGRQSGVVRRENAMNRGSTTVEPNVNQQTNRNEPSYLVSRNHVTRKREESSSTPPEKPETKVITGDTSLPVCLSVPIDVVDPPYTGTCIGYIVSRCEQQFGAVLSPSEFAELKSAINDGCIPGCDGSHPVDCALVIAEKLAAKGATRFRTSRLWLKCVREDRMEARR